MAIGQYILDSDGNPQLEPNPLKWALWFELSHLSPGKDNRIVAKDCVGEAHVSTVFLGLDYRYGRGTPILWETMIFGGEHDQYCRRYATRAEAEEGHSEAVRMLVESDVDIAELERMLALSGGWEKKE